jgi:spermidine synthase
MQPTEILARERTADGDELTLTRRDGIYALSLSCGELMSSRAHGSECALARLACNAMRPAERPRVLVGGLGFGYTLRAALDSLPAGAEVVVCELFELVLKANRGAIGDLAGRPLEDRRVSVRLGDVGEALGKERFDAILLDVDNGPEAFTVAGNSGLYSVAGIARLAASLEPGGVLAVWVNAAGAACAAYAGRLERAGFGVRVERVRARESGRGARHAVIVGRWG